MKSLILPILLACSLFASEQHPIVYGEYRPAPVTEAELRMALGTTDTLDLKPLGGGYSGGLLYTIVYQGKNYVVRRSGGIFGQAGIPQEVDIIQAASRRGIAPKILYANAESGLIVMEKIDSILPAEFNPGMLAYWPDILAQVAARLRILRDLQVDPAVVTARNDAVYFREMVAKVDKSLLPPAAKATIEKLLALPTDLKKKVVVHNDLHARNILSDGKNLYFIDWEIAGWGPEGYDVACMANFQTMNAEQGLAFYELYLQRKATTEEEREFARNRALHAGTRGIFLLSSNKPEGDDPLANIRAESSTLTMRNLMFQLDRERIDMTDPRTLYVCGLEWMRWAADLLYPPITVRKMPY